VLESNGYFVEALAFQGWRMNRAGRVDREGFSGLLWRDWNVCFDSDE
jgi:hypothetical protein